MTLTASIRQTNPSTVELTLQRSNVVLASISASSNVSLHANPTALIAAFLPVAAKMNEDLRIEGAVDSRAIENSHYAADLLSEWFQDLTRVDLISSTNVVNDTEQRGLGCMMSLGLDSFYSFYTRREDVTHLVLCNRFDIFNDEVWERTLEACKSLAEAEAKQLIVVSTNLREFTDDYLDWSTQYHGAAIAFVAHLLDEYISHLLIPSSVTSDDDPAWGSHLRLDPLWSSSRLTLEHHPRGVDRLEKMREVINYSLAMQYLRVCTKNQYNCGRCEKCIRTMCHAIALGAGGRIQTMPPDLFPEDILAMRLSKAWKLDLHIQNLQVMRRLPSNLRRLDLEVALEELIAGFVA